MRVAKQTYYLDENRKLITDQTKAAFVVVSEGQEVTPDMLAKHPDLKSHELSDGDLPDHVGQTAEDRKAIADRADAVAKRTKREADEVKAATPVANKAKVPAENK